MITPSLSLLPAKTLPGAGLALTPAPAAAGDAVGGPAPAVPGFTLPFTPVVELAEFEPALPVAARSGGRDPAGDGKELPAEDDPGEDNDTLAWIAAPPLAAPPQPIAFTLPMPLPCIVPDPAAGPDKSDAVSAEWLSAAAVAAGANGRAPRSVPAFAPREPGLAGVAAGWRASTGMAAASSAPADLSAEPRPATVDGSPDGAIIATGLASGAGEPGAAPIRSRGPEVASTSPLPARFPVDPSPPRLAAPSRFAGGGPTPVAAAMSAIAPATRAAAPLADGPQPDDRPISLLDQGASRTTTSPTPLAVDARAPRAGIVVPSLSPPAWVQRQSSAEQTPSAARSPSRGIPVAALPTLPATTIAEPVTVPEPVPPTTTSIPVRPMIASSPTPALATAFPGAAPDQPTGPKHLAGTGRANDVGALVADRWLSPRHRSTEETGTFQPSPAPRGEIEARTAPVLPPRPGAPAPVDPPLPPGTETLPLSPSPLRAHADATGFARLPTPAMPAAMAAGVEASASGGPTPVRAAPESLASMPSLPGARSAAPATLPPAPDPVDAAPIAATTPAGQSEPAWVPAITGAPPGTADGLRPPTGRLAAATSHPSSAQTTSIDTPSPAPPAHATVASDLRTHPANTALARPDPAPVPIASRPAPAAAAALARGVSPAGFAARAPAAWRNDSGRRDGAVALDTMSPAAMLATETPLGVFEATAVPLDLGDRQWPARMIERIEALRDAADAADTSIRLAPDALGAVEVSLRRDGDVVHVHLAAEQAATRALLQDAQPRLAELAGERGLRLGESTVGGGEGGQSREQDAPTPGRTPARLHDDTESPNDERIA